MSLDILLSIIRQLMLICGPLIVTHGIVNSGQWESMSGAVITLTSSAWAIWKVVHNSNKQVGSADPIGKQIQSATSTGASNPNLPPQTVISQTVAEPTKGM